MCCSSERMVLSWFYSVWKTGCYSIDLLWLKAWIFKSNIDSLRYIYIKLLCHILFYIYYYIHIWQIIFRLAVSAWSAQSEDKTGKPKKQRMNKCYVDWQALAGWYNGQADIDIPRGRFGPKKYCRWNLCLYVHCFNLKIRVSATSDMRAILFKTFISNSIIWIHAEHLCNRPFFLSVLWSVCPSVTLCTSYLYLGWGWAITVVSVTES